MSLADIKKKIEGDAAAQAASLLDKAKAESAGIRQKAESDVAKSAAAYDKQFAEESPALQRNAKIVAGLDVKKLALEAKQKLISQAFDKALKMLCEMADAPYLDFVGKLLGKSVKTGDEEVVVSASEKRITSDWIASYNQSHGTKLALASDHADIAGGFILRHGRISVNCAFDTLVRWLRDDLEAEIVQRLFDGK